MRDQIGEVRDMVQALLVAQQKGRRSHHPEPQGRLSPLSLMLKAQALASPAPKRRRRKPPVLTVVGDA